MLNIKVIHVALSHFMLNIMQVFSPFLQTALSALSSEIIGDLSVAFELTANKQGHGNTVNTILYIRQQ